LYLSEERPYTRNSMTALLSIRGTYKLYNEEDLMGYINDVVERVEKERRERQPSPNLGSTPSS
jgi:hypothetical protein